MFGVEVTQISVLYFISYMSAADSLKSLIEATENTAQEYKIVVRSNRHEHKRKGGGDFRSFTAGFIYMYLPSMNSVALHALNVCNFLVHFGSLDL